MSRDRSVDTHRSRDRTGEILREIEREVVRSDDAFLEVVMGPLMVLLIARMIGSARSGDGML